MRIAVINPNTSEPVTSHILAAAREVASTPASMVAFTATRGPAAIESHVDEAYAAAEVARIVTAKLGFDAYIVACASDPGVAAARELTRSPVVGIGEAAFLLASMLGGRFSIITTLDRGVEAVRRQVRSHGLADRCASVLAAGLTVLESGSAPGAAGRLAEQATLAVTRDGAEVIVMGCAEMSELAEAVSQTAGVPVVDGVRAAVVLAEGLVRCGLATSKAGAYAYPEPLAYAGMTAPSRMHRKRPAAEAP
jgi:allantoin racemase